MSRLAPLFAAACALACLAMTAHAAPATKPAEATVTVLYDAFGKDAGTHKDWGYAALVEYGDTRILFDTGNDPEVFRRNVEAKKVDLAKLDFVVMSHRHGDHMGGMDHLLAVNPKVKIYAPKEGFGVYGGDLPATFYRRDASLPAEQRYFDGTPPETLRFGSAWPKANIALVDKTIEVAPGVHLIALVSDKTGTLELRELSLALETTNGTVLVVGCSHPGLDRIVEAATAIDPRIQLIARGFHLVVADDAAIGTLATALDQRFKVKYLAPGHCTGEPAFAAFRKAFGERFLYAGLGSRIVAGATPRASAAVIDDADLRDYRAALALRGGDDHHDHGELAVH